MVIGSTATVMGNGVGRLDVYERFVGSLRKTGYKGTHYSWCRKSSDVSQEP
jgi:hypothetical protein